MPARAMNLNFHQKEAQINFHSPTNSIFSSTGKHRHVLMAWWGTAAILATWKARAAGTWIGSQLALHSKFKTDLNYILRPYLKRSKTKRKTGPTHGGVPYGNVTLRPS